jgi:hypothetical protein
MLLSKPCTEARSPTGLPLDGGAAGKRRIAPRPRRADGCGSLASKMAPASATAQTIATFYKKIVAQRGAAAKHRVARASASMNTPIVVSVRCHK